jgi:hypothetical protein
VRAAYGGIFTVMGVYTVLAAMDPATNRGRILMIGSSEGRASVASPPACRRRLAGRVGMALGGLRSGMGGVLVAAADDARARRAARVYTTASAADDADGDRPVV